MLATALATSALGASAVVHPAAATSPSDLNSESNVALRQLLDSNPNAARVAKSAVAILVFPSIVKAGFVFGAAYGEGELQQGGKVDGYYNSFTGSWGLQAGAQSYGYVVFLMNQHALSYLRESHGWEIGVGPTVVVVNEGIAKNLSTSTLQDDAYAFIFDQKGLMLGISLEGSKISHIAAP
jgi:lipid-binding SYLF domain-containing protein